MMEQFLSANPILPVTNVWKTAAFFREKLGFDIVVLWRDPAYGVVRRGGTVIEFGEGRKAHAGSGVCSIRVNDADEIHQEWASKGVTMVGDLADREYGCRDFRVRDNNGNMLIVGHDLENQDALIKRGNLVGQEEL